MITDLRSYAALGTDDLPRLLARDSTGKVYLDSGPLVTALAGDVGTGASMIPFRPNASPQSWMYIASSGDYQKVSAPDSGNDTVVQKVGIAEPSGVVDAAPLAQRFLKIVPPTSGVAWATGGTASGLTTSDRSSDTIGSVFPDPASGLRWSIQVSPSVAYQRGEVIQLQIPFAPAVTSIIEDVIPPLDGSFSILNIRYDSGSTGSCVVVPGGLAGVSAPGSIYADQVLSTLRRGALVTLGSETCFVSGTARGPDGQLAFFTSTTVPHDSGELITGVPAIVVGNCPGPPAGTATGDPGGVNSFAVATGTGTLTMGSIGGAQGTVVAHPFTYLNGWGPNGHVGDYEHGVNQGHYWGLDSGSTNQYGTPDAACDGDQTTSALMYCQHQHHYFGCLWVFTVGSAPPGPLYLNILSEVPANGQAGWIVTLRDAGIWYSLDSGTTWTLVYQTAGPRGKQWDSIALPAGQDLNQVQVMAFADAHDDMVHYVYEINATQTTTSQLLLAVGSFRPDDYIHFSVKLSDPTQLTDLTLKIDVGDGSFQSDYYYYTADASLIVEQAGGSLNTSGLANAVAEQLIINEGSASAGVQVPASVSAGANQWSEVWFPISALQRIGGDQTKTLANARGVQFSITVAASITCAISSLLVAGGGQPDVGDDGAAYQYRVVPRSSTTGAKGNASPTMRHGVWPRRQPVQLVLPSAAYDSQIDTWDIERYGGTILSWRWIGSCPASAGYFTDDYFDDAASAGDEMETDNFEPWPSIGNPFSVTSATGSITVEGPWVTVTYAGTWPAEIARWLPGTLIQIGGQTAYTLRNRPVSLSSTSYLFELEENAGYIAAATAFTVNEPVVGRQMLPSLWGPNAQGDVFAVEDPLQPGRVRFSKHNQPDSAPDKNSLELTSPSEPLIGGEVIKGVSYVSSSARWWGLYPSSQPGQVYDAIEQNIGRALVAPRGICTDGLRMYFWVKDGIVATGGGGAESLTDEDLFPLFPREGVAGMNVVRNGVTFYAPDYSRAGFFRLAVANKYLYADYPDSSGTPRTLVCDLTNKAWVSDSYANQMTVHYATEQQAGTLGSGSPTLYGQVYMGDVAGNVYVQKDLVNDGGVPISCTLGTFEWDGGQERNGRLWYDYYLDADPKAAITATPVFLGVGVATPTTVASSPTRTLTRVDVGEGSIERFLGLQLNWTEDFNSQTLPTILYQWIGFALPDGVSAWRTQFLTHGLEGYQHISRIQAAWASTQPVTLAITAYDGTSPQTITLPSTSGVLHKQLLSVTFNKGQLYKYSATSTAPFQLDLANWIIFVGQWGRTGKYVSYRLGDRV
jgi:hypothetical protein